MVMNVSVSGVHCRLGGRTHGVRDSKSLTKCLVDKKENDDVPCRGSPPRARRA